MSKENTITVSGVYKDFVLPHEKVNSLKKAFIKPFRSDAGSEVQHALHDISFQVKKGEFFGIVGRNGSGKSTLLKILAGIYQPTQGTIQTHGKLVPFIELGVGFNAELTGRENVYLNGAMLGFSRKEIDAQYEHIVEFAELERFMDQKLKNYSSGMQVRLAFSVATTAKADILLIDEVLAVGDADFQRKCFDYFKKLKSSDTTVIFVTHDMNAVREYCDRAILIENSRLVAQGKPDNVARQYSKLFMNESVPDAIIDEEKRWGDGGIKFQDIEVINDGKYIIVKAKAKATSSISRLLFGIHIVSADGAELVATNNRMIGVDDIMDVEQFDNMGFEWKILNVFNDGDYTIDLTLVSSTNEIHDWYKQAGSFKVRREQRSTTNILPPIKLITRKLG